MHAQVPLLQSDRAGTRAILGRGLLISRASAAVDIRASLNSDQLASRKAILEHPYDAACEACIALIVLRCLYKRARPSSSTNAQLEASRVICGIEQVSGGPASATATHSSADERYTLQIRARKQVRWCVSSITVGSFRSWTALGHSIRHQTGRHDSEYGTGYKSHDVSRGNLLARAS